MPSFDVVSELDKHEVTNAVENAVKELDRRYDLKGKGSFEFKEKELTVNLTAEADFQLEAMIEILKLAQRFLAKPVHGPTLRSILSHSYHSLIYVVSINLD